MKKARVLDDIDGHKLNPKSGLIILTCGDPDQHPEMYDYKVSKILEAGCCKRVTPMSPLGGALRIAENSPANQFTPHYAEGLIFDIKYLVAHKDVSTVALYTHAPCGMAGLVNLNFDQIVRLAFNAKERIKSEIPNVRVAVFCHIDYGDGRKKTYFIPKNRWKEYERGGMHRLRLMYPNRVTIIPPRIFEAGA